MSDFICGKLVEERKNGLVLSYILEDNQYFFQIAYKILQKKENLNFVKCYKSMWNGKVKLSYSIEKYSTLYQYAGALSKSQYYLIIQNILKILDEFRSNGLIPLETIDLSYDKVLFDENSNILLVCVPLAISSTPETLSMFDYTVKNFIIEMLEKSGYMEQPEFSIICQDCKDVHMSINDIYSNFKIKRYVTEDDMGTENGESGPETILLSGLNTDERILLEQQSAVLGKSPEMSDKVITGSSSVSRKHCRIVKEQGEFWVEDLKSLNHTFVNGIMLNQGERKALHTGDCLRLADIEFEVM